MRMIKNILRLKSDCGFSHDRIAASLGISAGAVPKCVGLADAPGRDWASACATWIKANLSAGYSANPWGHQPTPVYTIGAFIRNCAVRV
jgi:hypothetical protein